MIISLLPYWDFILIIGSISWIIFVFFHKNNLKFLFTKINTILTILLICGTLLFTVRIITFCFINKNNNITNGKTIKIAFFNTLYDNDKYDLLNSEIKKVDADIIGLAELSPDRIDKIGITKMYPYFIIDNNIRHKDVGIFSKFPIQENKNLDDDTDFFFIGAVNIEGKNYNIIVAHPTPPMSEEWNRLRNIVLAKLIQRINLIDEHNTLLIGDFNLTPWPPRYSDFLNQIPSIKDTAQGKGLNATWNDGPIFTHIDHIFVPKEMQILDFHIHDNAGSDHHLIYAIIKL